MYHFSKTICIFFFLLTALKGQVIMASDLDDEPKSEPPKKIKAINEIANAPLAGEPKVFTARIATILSSVPSDLSADSENGVDYIVSISDALQKLEDQHCAGKKLQTPEISSALALLITKFVDLLHRQNSTKYEPLPVRFNVSPPKGSGIPAGGAPEKIKDPAKREIYLASIATNEKNARLNRFHDTVMRYSEKMDIVIESFLTTPGTKEHLDSDLYKKLKDFLPSK